MGGRRKEWGRESYLLEESHVVSVVIVGEVENPIMRVPPHPAQPLAPDTEGQVTRRLPRLALVTRLLNAHLSPACRAHLLSLLVGMLPCRPYCLERSCTSSLVAILICHGCALVGILECR